ncbi:hypothetical protein AK812_SmicGene33361 [Symbiodinium microadriaticum]|uniref:Uncharacterized protein n=1 Tax=Symbiodinium microadriaticum TaxID=2951 RepID=A0A1Q9CRS0_SYMMI|nr:hypothetical protein AK812_SmicGene33361 [Symbiodinium microadriaticum]
MQYNEPAVRSASNDGTKPSQTNPPVQLINAACGADVFCNCDAFTDMPRIVLFLLLPFASPPWRRMASAQPRGHREIDCGEAPARPSERRQTVAALAQIWDPQTLASFSMSQLDGLSDVMCGYCPQLSREDIQLLLSFALGILFVRSAETIFDESTEGLHPFGMSRSIFMLVVLVAATLAAASEGGISAEAPADYWHGAVQEDIQLLLSFALGILFVRSAETIFDESTEGHRQHKKLELYPLLA